MIRPPRDARSPAYRTRSTLRALRSATHRLVLVFALALVVRAAWVATLPDTLVWPDEHEFVAVARHLAAGDGYVSGSYRANPVLPLYLAAVFRVAGESFAAARLGQAVMGALTCVVIAATATRLLGPQVGIVSGVLLALYLPHVYLSGVFYVECLFTLLVALTIWCAVRSLDDGPRIRWLVATGASAALAALTRPIFLAALPLLAVAIAWARPAAGTRRLAAAAIVVGTTVLGIAPWTARNYRVLAAPVVVSAGFGTKLWQGNNEGAVGDADDRELSFREDVWKARVAALPAPERAAVEARYRDAARRIDTLRAATGDYYAASDAVLGPLAVAFITSHPDRAAVLFAHKLRTFFLPFSKTLVTTVDTTVPKRALATVAYVPILLLAVLGAWWSAGRTRGLAVIYAVVCSLTGTYALLTTCTRFRLPLDPYLIVLAAAAVVELREQWSRKACEERALLAADAPHGAAVRHHEAVAEHARAGRFESDR